MEWDDRERFRAGIAVALCMYWLSALLVVLAILAWVSEGRIAERD